MYFYQKYNVYENDELFVNHPARGEKNIVTSVLPFLILKL
jgi:hypothetical protein